MDDKEDDFLSVLQVSSFLKTTPRTIYNLISDGQLPAVDIGSKRQPRWRISREDFLKFQSRRKTRIGYCSTGIRERLEITTPQIMG